MFFRFSAALILIVIVSMASVALEKRTLELRRSISRQYYQTDLMIELHVRLRLETQRLTAPAQLASIKTASPKKSLNVTVGNRRAAAPQSRRTSEKSPQMPLLRFQQPFDPDGKD